jgi:hypothetical protein
MRKLFLGLAAGGLLASGAALITGVAAKAATPVLTQCLPPSGQSAPLGTASGVIMVIGQQGSGTASCSYTDTSTTAPQYGAFTPNSFTITATHAATVSSTGTYSCSSGTLSGTSCVDATASGSPATDLQNGSPSPTDVTGTLTGAKTGDTITVTVTLASVPGDPTGQASGGLGTIAVGSPS